MKKIILIFLFSFTGLLSFSQIAEEGMEMDVDDTNLDQELDEISSILVDSLNRESLPIVNKYYLGNGIRLNSSTSDYAMAITGYIQSALQTHMYSGDDDLYSRWRMRRARVRLNGVAMKDKIRYRVGVDMVRGSESDEATGGLLMDAWMAYRPFGDGKLSITFGQRSTHTDNRENFMNSTSLQLAERSRLAAMFGTVREVGFTVQSSHKVGKQGYLRPSVVITDGDGAYDFGKRYGGMKYGARLNYLPFGTFRRGGEFLLGDLIYELKPKLSLGSSYSYNIGTSDRRGGRDGGDILYMNNQGRIDLPDFARMNLDFLFKFRGWNFLGEYTKTWAYIPSSITTRVRNDGSTTDNFEVDGEQHIENYIKNRMILGSAFNIQGGYTFRNFWAVNARYTHIMPDKYSYLNNDLYYKRNNIYEFSVAKYLTKNYSAKVMLTGSLYKTDGEVRYHNGTFSGYEGIINIMTQIAF